MDEKFRLVFRGELLDGQHRAVVKRRLAERLKLDDGQLEKLFSGDTVVVKRDADKETAARYQTIFKQAGGLLRVLPAGVDPTGGKTRRPQENPGDRSAHGGGSQGSDQALASARIRAMRPAANPDVDAPDFKVETDWRAPPAEPAPEIHAPAYVIAEVGARLAEPDDTPLSPVVEVNFELAEAGVDLLEHSREAVVVDLGPLDFELAEVGADLGPGPRTPTARAPDVSHLALVEA